MDANKIFITTLTEKTGITYDKIYSVYKESGLQNPKDVCKLFMNSFQLSFGFANTLAEIIIEDDEKMKR